MSALDMMSAMEQMEENGDELVVSIPQPPPSGASDLSIQVEEQQLPPYKFREPRLKDIVEAMTDSEFKSVFRMSRDCFWELVQKVAPFYDRQGMSTNGKSLIPAEKILIFLHWASGDIRSQFAVLTFNYSAGTIKQAVHETIDAMMKSFVSEEISLPDENEARAEAALFKARSPGFPELAWCGLDGTHIGIWSVHGFREFCRNRHHTLSINCMIAAGASHKIFYVDSSCPGSFHDARVFRKSDLWAVLEDPLYPWVPFEDALILADSAYKVPILFIALNIPLCLSTPSTPSSLTFEHILVAASSLLFMQSLTGDFSALYSDQKRLKKSSLLQCIYTQCPKV